MINEISFDFCDKRPKLKEPEDYSSQIYATRIWFTPLANILGQTILHHLELYKQSDPEMAWLLE